MTRVIMRAIDRTFIATRCVRAICGFSSRVFVLFFLRLIFFLLFFKSLFASARFRELLFRCLSLVTHEGVKCTCFTFVVFSFPFISRVRVCVCICVCVQIINLAGSRPLVVHSLDSSCSPIPASLQTVSSSDEETHYRSLFSYPSFSSERAWIFFSFFSSRDR